MVGNAQRAAGVLLISLIIIYRVRVSTPSTQNPDERARSDRAHATPGRVGAA